MGDLPKYWLLHVHHVCHIYSLLRFNLYPCTWCFDFVDQCCFIHFWNHTLNPNWGGHYKCAFIISPRGPAHSNHYILDHSLTNQEIVTFIMSFNPEYTKGHSTSGRGLSAMVLWHCFILSAVSVHPNMYAYILVKRFWAWMLSLLHWGELGQCRGSMCFLC